MSSISFTFSAESSDADRVAALRQIESWPGVKAAGLVKADARNANVRRMAMLMLESGQATEVIARLRALPVIEQANLPAQRGLPMDGSADSSSAK